MLMTFSNFKKMSYQIFSSAALLGLSACGQDAGDLSEKLQESAYTVTQYGCSGQQMVRPSDSSFILRIQFTSSEMITSQSTGVHTDGDNNNNSGNYNYNGNNYNYGNNSNANNNFTEVDRDTVRYIDKETLEVVSMSSGQVDRLRIEFRDDDRSATLTTHATGSTVNCPQGSSYIIELQR